MTEFDIPALQKKYNLMYHVPHVLEGEAKIGYRGKDVLEIGGSLPRGLVIGDIGAKSWIAIEEFDYYTEIHKPSTIQPTAKLAEVASVAALGDYAIVSGRVEKLTPVFSGRFDAIFSTSAFEHIDHFPTALDRMYDALRPGGKLFATFTPIWSCHEGHHLHRVIDASGKLFGYENNSLPPWWHLLLTPPQMFSYLLDHTDRDAAAEIVYQVYNSSGINRLFTEDYIGFFESSRFKVESIAGIFHTEMPAELQTILEGRHPPYKNFANGGLSVVLEKEVAKSDFSPT